MRKKLTGVVTSDKRDKTVRVEIDRRYSHPMYGKIVRGRTVCQVHDDGNVAKHGDVVEIEECRPMSKTKRWKLLRVVKTSELAELSSDSEEQP